MLRQACGTILLLLILGNPAVHASGDVKQGSQAFGQCTACHSVELGRHLTGPSLAGVVGRKAGITEGFVRYSPALGRSGITWTVDNLDQWLRNPTVLVPGTSMRFRGMTDAVERQNLIAFLQSTSDSDVRKRLESQQAGRRMPNLKKVGDNQRVVSIRYCGDTYYVTLGTGQAIPFWEFNLRFKSDSSSDGPFEGQPAIVGAGMMGDKAQVVFASPAEISTFIVKDCKSS